MIAPRPGRFAAGGGMGRSMRFLRRLVVGLLFTLLAAGLAKAGLGRDAAVTCLIFGGIASIAVAAARRGEGGDDAGGGGWDSDASGTDIPGGDGGRDGGAEGGGGGDGGGGGGDGGGN